MKLSRRPGCGASTNAFWGDLRALFAWREFLFGWRSDVWRGAEAAVGEKDCGGCAEPHTARGKCVAAARGGQECFGGNGERNYLGREVAKYLWNCGGRPSAGIAREARTRAWRYRRGDQHAPAF